MLRSEGWTVNAKRAERIWRRGLAPTGTLGLQAVPLRSGGRQRLVLLVDFGMTEYSVGYAILALFEIEGDARLLDAADVALDRGHR